jgi:hypothetical protein
MARFEAREITASTHFGYWKAELFGVWDTSNRRYVEDERDIITFEFESNARLMARVIESRNS